MHRALVFAVASFVLAWTSPARVQEREFQEASPLAPRPVEGLEPSVEPKADPSTVIDGGRNPEKIPNLVAYRLFFRSLIELAAAAATVEQAESLSLRDVQRRHVTSSLGLTNVENDRLLIVIRRLGRELKKLDAKASAIKDAAWPEPDAAAIAQLELLQGERDDLIRRVMKSLPRALGRSGAGKLGRYVMEHVRRRTRIDVGPRTPPSARALANTSSPFATLDGLSCGAAGGNYCSQTGACPGGYTSLGETYDCSPCCLSGPSCGALGGDYCSPSSSCPAGYRSLGRTYDCRTCCQAEPSCGQLGGDYCSPSASCPLGYQSLGRSFDCRTCCRFAPTGPSCGALGGDYCSSGGSCPEGYRSLGNSWDCRPCCVQMTGQSMSGRVYTYTEVGTDFSVIWGRGITEADYNTYGHQYRVQTTLTSSKGRTSTGSGGRSVSYTVANVSLPWDNDDLGDYVVESWHSEFCPFVNQEWPLSPTRVTIPLGVSISVWLWDGGFHTVSNPAYTNIHCVYMKRVEPCNVACIPSPGDVEYALEPGQTQASCPPVVGYMRFFYEAGNTYICAPKGTGFVFPLDPTEPQVCTEVSGF